LVQVQGWAANISKDVETQLSEIYNKYVYYSLTVDELPVQMHMV